MTIEDDLGSRIKKAVEECDKWILWYQRHGGFSFRASRFIDIAAIILGMTSPLMIMVSRGQWAMFAAAAFASFSTVITTISKYMKFDGEWRRFCKYEQMLIHEKFLYSMKSHRYSKCTTSEDALRLFAHRIVVIHSQEQLEWKLSIESRRANTEVKPRYRKRRVGA